MKLNFKTLSLAFVVMSSIQSSTVAFAAADVHEADHVALRALRDKAATAINTQDIKALASCFAKDFVFAAVNQTVLTNEAQMQDFFDRMFKSSDALVTSLKSEPTADILTRFVDANTGVCYGSSKDTYTMKSGEVVEMNVRWSATVVKENGERKDALAHVGADFLNNPVLDGAKALVKKTGIGAGVGGLLAGGILGFMTGRCKKAGSAGPATGV